MAEVEILSINESEKWNLLLSELPIYKKDFYYTPEYYKIYEKLGEGKARCFVFKQGNNLAMYPFLINSVDNFEFDDDTKYYDIQGAYGYNGVISSTNDSKLITKFYQEFDGWCKSNNIIAEFTRFHPLLHNHMF